MEKLGLLPAAVGEKKIKREGLCVVGWKRKWEKIRCGLKGKWSPGWRGATAV
jgi:hypothetical protein